MTSYRQPEAVVCSDRCDLVLGQATRSFLAAVGLAAVAEPLGGSRLLWPYFPDVWVLLIWTNRTRRQYLWGWLAALDDDLVGPEPRHRTISFWDLSDTHEFGQFMADRGAKVWNGDGLAGLVQKPEPGSFVARPLLTEEPLGRWIAPAWASRREVSNHDRRFADARRNQVTRMVPWLSEQENTDGQQTSSSSSR